MAARVSQSRFYRRTFLLSSEKKRGIEDTVPLLSKVGVPMKLKKCNFFTEGIPYLSHVISSRHLKISWHTTNSIKALKALRDVTNMNIFLGLCNAYDGSYWILLELCFLVMINFESIIRSTSHYTTWSSMRWRVSSSSWFLRQYWHYRTPGAINSRFECLRRTSPVRVTLGTVW